MKLIQGLLKALTVAHKDSNTILFDRIKIILTLIAKQNVQSKDAENTNACKMLLTEIMTMMLR
jgi:hypothetical protein